MHQDIPFLLMLLILLQDCDRETELGTTLCKPLLFKCFFLICNKGDKGGGHVNFSSMQNGDFQIYRECFFHVLAIHGHRVVPNF